MEDDPWMPAILRCPLAENTGPTGSSHSLLVGIPIKTRRGTKDLNGLKWSCLKGRSPSGRPQIQHSPTKGSDSTAPPHSSQVPSTESGSTIEKSPVDFRVSDSSPFSGEAQQGVGLYFCWTVSGVFGWLGQVFFPPQKEGRRKIPAPKMEGAT